MKRFEGVPQFEWLADVESGLYTTSQLGTDNGSVVSFQHNPYLRGMKWYKVLFDMIVNKRGWRRWLVCINEIARTNYTKTMETI